MKSMLLIFGLLVCSYAIEETYTRDTAQYDEEGHAITSSDMPYEELLDFCDAIWVQVESGRISPSEADEMFTEETGWDVIEWMSANGELSPDLDLDLIKDFSQTMKEAAENQNDQEKEDEEEQEESGQEQENEEAILLQRNILKY